MNNPKVCKILNWVSIACIVVSLIGDLVAIAYWTFIIGAAFKLFLVISLSIVEYKPSPAIVKPFSFLFYFLGRGIFNLILGFITIGGTVLTIVGNFVMVAIGVFYIIMHFTNKDNEPDFMSFATYQRLIGGYSSNNYTATNSYNTHPLPHQAPATPNHAYNSQFNPNYPTSPMATHDMEGKVQVSY